MTLPRTTADVLARHVLFEIESIDRLYLNLYVPELQRVGQVVGFLTRHLGFEIPSTAVIAPRSKAFGEVPIYLHQNDSRWVMRPDNCVHFWEGEQYSLFGGLSLVSTGGHFEGFQVLYWPAGAEMLLAPDESRVSW